MSATILSRTSLRTAGLIAATGTATYASIHLYRSQYTAHAEPLSSDTQNTLTKMSWSGFTPLTLQSSVMVNHNVKKLTFALPTPQTITGNAPITSLLSKHTPADSWIPVIRPYTPISSGSDLADAGTVTFLIKKYPGGKGSGKMHSLVPGDTISFRQLHEFDYTPNTYPSMLLIAGGSGITPLYQLSKAILGNPGDQTKVKLVYANNSYEDILLKGEFDALEREFPGRFKVRYTVSKASPEQGADGNVGVGYVTAALLEEVLARKGAAEKVKVLVSGPPAMTEAVAGAKGGFGWTQGSLGGILKELGFEKDDVHKF